MVLKIKICNNKVSVKCNPGEVFTSSHLKNVNFVWPVIPKFLYSNLFKAFRGQIMDTI